MAVMWRNLNQEIESLERHEGWPHIPVLFHSTLSSVLRHPEVWVYCILSVSFMVFSVRTEVKSHTSLVLQHHQWLCASSQSWAQTVPGESAAASAHSEELVSLPCPGTDTQLFVTSTHVCACLLHFRGRRNRFVFPCSFMTVYESKHLKCIYVNLKSSLVAGLLYCTVPRERSHVNRTCKCSLSPLSSSFLIKFHLVSASF